MPGTSDNELGFTLDPAAGEIDKVTAALTRMQRQADTSMVGMTNELAKFEATAGLSSKTLTKALDTLVKYSETIPKLLREASSLMANFSPEIQIRKADIRGMDTLVRTLSGDLTTAINAAVKTSMANLKFDKFAMSDAFAKFQNQAVSLNSGNLSVNSNLDNLRQRELTAQIKARQAAEAGIEVELNKQVRLIGLIQARIKEVEVAKLAEAKATAEATKQTEREALAQEKLAANALKLQQRNAYVPPTQGPQATLGSSVEDAAARRLTARRAQFGVDGGAGMLALQASFAFDAALLYAPLKALKDMWVAAKEVDAAFTHLQAVSGATNTEMGSLTKTITDTAVATRFTVSEMAEAATVLTKIGFTGEEVAKSLKDISNYAVATGATLHEAADSVSHIMMVFGLRATETGQVTDLLTNAVNKSKLGAEQMGTALMYVSQEAADANMSLTETVAAMSMAASAGIRSGSMMGTGLRKLIADLETPSAKLVEEFKSVGLSVEGVNIKTHGLVGTLRILADAGFTSENAMRGMDVRGAHLFSAVTRMMDNSDGLYETLTKSGTASEAAEKQMQSLEASTAKLGSAVSALSVSAFKPLQDTTAAVFRGLADGITDLSNFKLSVNSLATSLISLAAAYGAVRTAGVLMGLASMASQAVSLRAASQVAAIAAPAASAVFSGGLGLTAAGGLAAGAGVAASTGIGLPVAVILGLTAALSAGVLGWEHYQEGVKKTTASLDEARAKFNTSTAAMAEQRKVVDEVDKAMEGLARHGHGDMQDYDQIVAQLRVQFQGLGLQIDGSSRSVDSLINSLRNLKDAMPGKMSISLDDQLKGVRDQMDPRKRTAEEADWRLLNAAPGGDREGYLASLPIRKLIAGGSGEAGSTEWYNKLDEIHKKAVGDQAGLGKDTPAWQHLEELISALKNYQAEHEAVLSLVREKSRIEGEQGTLSASLPGSLAHKLSTSYTRVQQFYGEQDALLGNPKEHPETSGLENRKDFTQKRLETITAMLSADLDAARAEAKANPTSPGARASADMRQKAAGILSEAKKAADDALTAFEEERQKTLGLLAKEYASQAATLEKKMTGKTVSDADITRYADEARDALNQKASVERTSLEMKRGHASPGADTKEIELSLKALAAAQDEALQRLTLQEVDAHRKNFQQTIATFDAQQRNEAKKIDSLHQQGGLDYYKDQVRAEKPLQQAQAGVAQARGSFMTDGSAAINLYARQQELDTTLTIQKYDTLIASLDKYSTVLDRVQVGRNKAVEDAKAKFHEVQAKYADKGDDETARKLIADEETKYTEAQKKQLENSKELTELEKVRLGYVVSRADAEAKKDPTTIGEAFTGGWNKFADSEGFGKPMLTMFRDNLPSAFSAAKSSFAQFGSDVMMRTKSISQAFQDMATSILKAVAQMAMNQLAAGILGGVLKMVGGMGGGGSQAENSAGAYGAGSFEYNTSAMPGGGGNASLNSFNWNGGLIRRAVGGMTPSMTRDSVPILAAPGEFIMRQSAVDLIGADTLSNLNAQGNRRVSQSAPANANQSNDNKTPNVTNVWIVTPDQQPAGLGANDVLAIISKDVMQGGSTKKLIKSVVSGSI